MKLITTILSILVCFLATAQKSPYKLEDGLLKDKTTTLARFLPSSTNMMPLDDFLAKMKAFETEMQPAIDQEPDEKIKGMKAMDLAFFVRNKLNSYMMYYGMDTAAIRNVEKIIAEKKGSPDFNKFLMEASGKVYIKRLTANEKALIEPKVWNEASLNNEDLFKQSASYRQWIDNYIDLLKRTKYKADTTLGYSGQHLVKQRVVNYEITNPFIKECLNFTSAKNIFGLLRNRVVSDSTYKNFMATATNKTAKNEIQREYDNIIMMASNTFAPDFTYTSINNKKVSLKSFRGKYVYIDVWATWCIPCKAEIPFLAKLEEEYKNKNIQFVSLSVDDKTNKSKWQSFVTENKLGGVQVMADNAFNSAFIKKFNIMSIPRFILIGPDGKIIDSDAKRPSDAALSHQFDKLL